MRRRYVLDLFPSYQEAHEAKAKVVAENPDNEYQVRRYGPKFGLVHRLKTDEAQVVEANRRPKRRIR